DKCPEGKKGKTQNKEKGSANAAESDSESDEAHVALETDEEDGCDSLPELQCVSDSSDDEVDEGE
ncbi:hypothetical protein H0H93_006950, partial [Arthromyces matolae]